MADDDAAADAPPACVPNKVEIHVGGHIVVIESAEPLAEVVGYALGLHEQTERAAKQMPMGFATAGGQFERAEPYLEPGLGEAEEGDRAG